MRRPVCMQHHEVLNPEKATLEECQAALNVLFAETRGKHAFACRATIEVVRDGNPSAPVCVRHARGAYDPQTVAFFLGGLAEHVPGHAIQARLDEKGPQLHLRSVEELASSINGMVQKHQWGRLNRVAEQIQQTLGQQAGRGR